MPPNETRDDRVERLKNKFRSTPLDERVGEYVRYDRAAGGELAHPYPQEYVEDCRDALSEMLFEDYGKVQALDLLDWLIEEARERPSKPFIRDPNSSDED